MNSVRRCTLSLLLLIVLLSPMASARVLEEVFPQLSQSQIQVLLDGKMLQSQTLQGPIEQFAPSGSMAYHETIKASALNNAFSICAVTYIPYPEHMKTMDQEQRQVEIFNTIRSISTQEGLMYISHRAGNVPKVLIEKSWYLETPSSRKGLPDPVVPAVPKKETNYVFQRDSTFKSNVYRHEYTTNNDEIFLEVKNLETMRVFSIFAAVKPEQLAISMSTYQLEKGLVLYGIATIKDQKPVINILGYKVDLPSAFIRRVTALQNWFKEQFLK
ncbi:MAG: hypothetical protein GXY57_02555 [Erysipelotrichaceae bacterium]|nr:hypothetical protein [Erysipelotrichaceae bacterium]